LKTNRLPIIDTDFSSLKVAIVHDWLVGYAGGEMVLEQILPFFPQADIFTLCDFIPDDKREFLLNKSTTTSFLQKLPKAKTKYRSYLPLMPYAIEQFDLSDYDLVISSNCAVSHAVLTRPEQLSLSYMNNTMIYAWDLYHHYLNSAGLQRGLRGLMAKLIMHYVRMWDGATGNRPDHFIANSQYMAQRVAKLYRRDATVIYPPVRVDKFELCRKKEDYYVCVSRLVPFKRIDLIVEAFSRMPDKKLIIVGYGPELAKLKAMSSPNIEFTGYQDHAAVGQYLKRARAFIFSSVEPFGIAVVEAQACGTPVIAYDKGAACEIVSDGENGLLFHEQTVEGLIAAVNRFEKSERLFDPKRIRNSTMRFSVDNFRKNFATFVRQALDQHLNGKPTARTKSTNRIRKYVLDI